jgi:hypothetical protein
MTTPAAENAGITMPHIQYVCMATLPGHDVTGYILDMGGRQAARLEFATRSAASAVSGALSRVGYDTVWPADTGHGLHVIVRGWSADRLDARLDALRDVLLELAGDPSALASATLDKLATTPRHLLPGADGQERVLRSAAEELVDWISETAGVPALHDSQAPLADGVCAVQLNAARQLEMSINGQGARALAVAQRAVRLYTDLRGQMSHVSARDAATRQAGIAFGLRDPASAARTPTRFRPAPMTAREFPGAMSPAVSPAPAESAPPNSRGPARRTGRRPR